MIANYNNITEKYIIYNIISMAWQGHRGGKKISELSIVTIYSSIIIVTMLSDWLRSITTQGVQLRTLGFVVVVPLHTVYLAVSSPVYSASINPQGYLVWPSRKDHHLSAR